MSVYLYTTCSVLTVGCPVYTNDSLTTPAGNGQYYDGVTCWTVSGGIITGTGACTTTSTTTTTTTEAPPAYNYYTFTPCTGGAGVDYRSIQSLALGDIYTFLPYPPDRGCYEITSITASPNSNDLPTIYGPLSGCNDDNCIQL